MSEGVGIEIEKSGLNIAVVEDGRIKELRRKTVTSERTQWHILKETKKEYGERVLFTVPVSGLYGRLFKTEDEAELPYLVKLSLPDEATLYKFSYTSFGDEHFVAGVMRDEVTAYFNLVKRAGFEPLALDIPIFSALNALFHNYPEMRARDFFLYYMGEELSYIAFVRGVKPIIVTGFKRGKDEWDLFFMVTSELQEILAEGRYDFFIAGRVDDPSMISEIQDELEVEVEVLNPAKRFSIGEEIENPTLFSGAVGAALRARKYAGA